MTTSRKLFESYYFNDWPDSIQSSSHSFLFPPHNNADITAESIRTLFAPSAEALYVYRPSKRRRTLNRAVGRSEKSHLPSMVISYLYDKYLRTFTVSIIGKTDRALHGFLAFCKILGRQSIDDIQRSDLAGYVEHEQERGLKINSVKNHLQTVNVFIQYLVDNDMLPADMLQKKILINREDNL